MTEKLFYQDGYRKEFQAKVLSCEKVKEQYQVVLDGTAFFPEGGGQYGDIGWLDETEVLDTREKSGIIYHTVASPLEAGTTVTGRLNWEVRFDRM